MKKKYFLSAVCVVAALSTALPLLTRAAGKTIYGAIAYSMKGKQQGVGAGDTKDEAKKNALKFCGAKDCEVLIEYKDDCGALAVSKDGYYGTGESKDKKEAEANAMKFCKEEGKGCEMVLSDCTSEK